MITTMKRFRPYRTLQPSPLPLARDAGLRREVIVMIAMVCLLLASGIGLSPIEAQPDDAAAVASRENTIKAAYLYQFGRYIEWPARSFPTPESPFIIGVLKDDPIAVDLEQIAQLKKIQERPIQLLKFSSPSDVKPCHILFMSAKLAPEAQAEIMQRMQGKGILLVGDGSGFLEKGGMVRFTVEDNKVRIFIARKAAEQAGLAISAKLLQVAQVVD
jgi:hypothetical protein